MSTWTERKVAPKKWVFRYVRIVRKKPSMMKALIKATQYALKISKDSYKLVMEGRRY